VAYQVCRHHYDDFLELTNGDEDDAFMTSDEFAALQVAGNCNVVTYYICDRSGKSTAYKEGIIDNEVYPYVFHFPEGNELKDFSGPRSKRAIEVPDLDDANSGNGC
jgi:hypothetical protein